jgi:hypothetical protein
MQAGEPRLPAHTARQLATTLAHLKMSQPCKLTELVLEAKSADSLPAPMWT